MAAWAELRCQIRFLSRFWIFLLAVKIAEVSALSQLYCSRNNTQSVSKGSNTFQSNGLCADACRSAYAFAIVQYQDCWCSDDVPPNRVPVRSCNEPCPGYPQESCGSRADGLFGYIRLSKEPADTWEGSERSTFSSTTTNAAVSSEPSSFLEPSPVTVQETVTAPSVRVSLITVTPPASPTSSTFSPPDPPSTPLPNPGETVSTPTTPATITDISSSTSKWSATPFASIITVTGQVKTITVTPTAPPEPTNLPQTSSKPKGFPLASVVGISIGGASFIILVLGLAAWWNRRRKRKLLQHTKRVGDEPPQRRPSRLSEMGLVSGSPRTTGDKRVSSIHTGGWGPSNHAEKSPSDTATPMDLRNSYPRVVDQRLDPVALWNPLHDNGSHISVRSFQDYQDYSRRMLRVANPDDK